MMMRRDTCHSGKIVMTKGLGLYYALLLRGGLHAVAARGEIKQMKWPYN